MYIFDVSFYGLHIAPTWYGLMYAFGFIICYFFVKRFYVFRIQEHLDTLLSYIFFGVILGGRLGYIFFYNLSFFIDNPIQILKIWEWGMSFHGGFLGVVLAVYLFCRKYGYRFWSLIDILAIIIPVALWLGRIGNWVNGELLGYAPYEGIFPMIIWGVYHFPSPLLEMLLEGILLFIIMLLSYIWLYRKPLQPTTMRSKTIPYREKTERSIVAYQNYPWLLSGIFLIGYSTARLISEQYRLPDAHIGYLLSTSWLTLGILYTIPMMVYGVYLVVRR